MFGYVKINKEELKIKDYNIYKTVYCSLCRELGRNYGLAARMTLNYDYTFLALLRLSVQEPEPCFADSRCTFNPLVKCKKCDGKSETFSYVTAVAVLLFYYKLLDNIADSRFLKRFAARCLKLLFTHSYKKAAGFYPAAAAILSDMAKGQAEAEASFSSVDAAAHSSAHALGSLSAFSIQDPVQKEVLYRLGYCLGRYVYFIDALDDFVQDNKQGAFNVFAAAENIELAAEIIRHSIGEAVHAYYLLSPRRYGPVLENILTQGLDNTLIQVVQKTIKERQMQIEPV